MAASALLIDTDILIDYLKSIQPLVPFLIPRSSISTTPHGPEKNFSPKLD